MLFVLFCVPTLGINIEQAHVRMPNIDFYLYDDQFASGSVTEDNISVFFDENSIEVSSITPVGESDQGTYYVYLLDVSASIYQNSFWDIRHAILNNHYRLGENDSMAVITFGDEVNVVLSGGESYEQAAEVLDALECSDMTTHFYDAMETLVELCGNVDGKRKVAIAISDGVNDTAAGSGTTREELMDKLRQSGIALNALCVDGSGTSDYNEQAIDEFGAIARTNGGRLYMFGSYSQMDADAAFEALYADLAQCWLLKAKAATNIADGKKHSLRVNIGAESASTELVVDRWVADTIPPTVTSVSYDGTANVLTVVFSEYVSGIEDIYSYDFVNSANEHISFAGITVSGSTASLSFADVPYNDNYKLTISGIEDISMEKNKLSSGVFELTIDNGREYVEEKEGLPLWLFIVLGAAFLVVVAVVVVLVISRKKDSEEVIITPPEYRPDESGKVRIKPGGGSRVGVELSDGRGWQQYFELSIGTSAFVGRSDENDVIIDFDKRVSSQHFALEVDGGMLFVTDLGSTNGTMLNNIAIKPDVRHKLSIGDIIRFGDSKMTIRAVSI